MKLVYFIIVSLVPFTILAKANIYEYIRKDGVLVLSNKPKAANLNKRIMILNEELTKETSSLNKEEKMLNENKYLGTFMTKELLLESINVHKKNIEILKKQLGVIN